MCLRRFYPDSLIVEHEPVGPRYWPRRYFRCYSNPDAILAVPKVRRHLARLEQETRYVETGWQSFTALPLLAERFPDRLGVVHLTRHPVTSALSHLTHLAYAGSERDDDLTRMAILAPTDPGVFLPEYADRWPELSPYEKCLYWWTEVHLFGLEFPERFGEIPFLRITSEDLLAGERQTLDRLLSFLDLPWDERWLGQTEKVVDRYHLDTDQRFDPSEVRRHPTTVDVARRLGYDIESFDVAALESRYLADPARRLKRKVRRFVTQARRK
jgi:hypothetical protein